MPGLGPSKLDQYGYEDEVCSRIALLQGMANAGLSFCSWLTTDFSHQSVCEMLKLPSIIDEQSAATAPGM